MCPLPFHLHFFPYVSGYCPHTTAHHLPPSIPSSLHPTTPHIQSQTPKLTPHPGTSIGSIRNRISALRVKQRDLYLDLSWDLPEGGAGHSAKKTATTPRKTPLSKKRGVDAVEADGLDEEEVATPSKKPRVKKAKTQAKKKEEESVEEDGSEERGGDGKNVGVKEEVLDEELDEMV